MVYICVYFTASFKPQSWLVQVVLIVIAVEYYSISSGSSHLKNDTTGRLRREKVQVEILPPAYTSLGLYVDLNVWRI